MRKAWKFIALVLACGILAVSVPEKTLVSATNGTSESIAQKKDEINQAKEERKKLQQGLSDIKKMVANLEKSKSSLQNYVKELDSQLMAVEAKIQELKDLISEKEKEIEQTKKELEEAIAIEEKQYEEMKVRIKFMYEKGSDFYLEMMFGADSFGDMLNKAQYVESISAYDRQKLEEFQLNRELIEVCKAFRFSFGKRFKYLYFPTVLPYFVSSCRNAIGVAWKAGVAAEVLAVTPLSIGKQLYNAKLYLETSELFAWTVIVVIMSLIIEKLIVRAIGRLDKRRHHVKT